MTELWTRVTDFENLLTAFEKARRGKRGRPEVQRFELELEWALCDLQQALRDKRYRPGRFRTFTIYDRKARQICAAPFPDRVVHHALMNVVEPLFEKILAPHCYACRKGLGVHRAVAHYQRAAARYPYALKLDVASYFASIDHDLLREQLRYCIPDPDVVWLFGQIIDSAPPPAFAPLWPGADLVDAMQRRSGLPIGNLTSQHLGNLYLNPIDQWLQRERSVPRWLRYVDDVILLGDSKPALWRVLDELRDRLAALRLAIHPRKCELYRCRDGVEVLGYRVFPNRRRLRRDNGYRYRRRLRKLSRDYAHGKVELDKINASVAAWLGHTRHADARGLQNALLGAVSFQRGDLS